MQTIHHQIYLHLLKLIPSLPPIPTYAKSKVSGYMDLNLDLLEQTSDKSIIALSHYYKHPTGDMIPDPDMTIRVNLPDKTAEALTYQDIYRYDEVYPDGNVDEAVKRSLDTFLLQWLKNCVDQKHSLEGKKDG